MAGTETLPLEAILLAAGRSRRMGGPDKLLLPVEGMPMVRRSALLYLDLGMTVTVVTGIDGASVAAALAGLEVLFVANPDADRGQQTSVRAGFAATPLRAAGVIVALSDQPLLTKGDVTVLAAAFADHGGNRICIPRHAGARGNPVVFPADCARRLRGDPGSASPRGFIDAHPELIAWFEADNDHFTRDIDTPQDAADLLGGDAARISPC